MIILREALSKDAKAITLIEEECFNDPWSESSILDEINQEYSVFNVLLINDEVVGYAGLRMIIDEGHIMNIAIAKDYQQKGLGEKLLKDLLECGYSLGINQFTLEVRESNVKAIKLYEKFGFSIAGKRKAYYSYPTEDGVIMWKRS